MVDDSMASSEPMSLDNLKEAGENNVLDFARHQNDKDFFASQMRQLLTHWEVRREEWARNQQEYRAHHRSDLPFGLAFGYVLLANHRLWAILFTSGMQTRAQVLVEGGPAPVFLTTEQVREARLFPGDPGEAYRGLFNREPSLPAIVDPLRQIRFMQAMNAANVDPADQLGICRIERQLDRLEETLRGLPKNALAFNLAPAIVEP